MASSQEEAIKRLREKGLWVTELKEEKEHPLINPVWAWAYETFNIFRPRAKHYSVFFRSLSSALSAGMTLNEALHMLSSSSPHGALRKAAAEGKLIASSKVSLSHVLSRYPHLFPRFIISMIQVGEESGRLDLALNLLAEYYEREYEHSLELKRETFYPMLLCIFLILYTSGLSPMISMLMGKISTYEFILSFLKSIFSYAIIIASCYFAVKGLYCMPLFKFMADAILLSFPLIGSVRRRIVEARFLRALAMLQSSGVDAGRSLSLAGEASGSKIFEACCNKAASLVSDGRRISEAIALSSRHLVTIQPTTLHMISTAEVTGTLDDLLPRLATQYEQEAFTAIRQRTVTIGVIALLIVAIMIGARVISFYLGYYGKLPLEGE